jgi:predicted cupin superfamily sugar epimerase
MRSSTEQIIRHFGFKRLPVEGTLYIETYRSGRGLQNGQPAGTAMIGLYCREPLSLSCFHRLAYDEVWHFYLGDPLVLYLLHPDGSSEEVVMGPDLTAGQQVQFTVPAGVWQGGCLAEGGEYALFGCTMAPGFTPGCFEAGLADRLTAQYPDRADIIRKLSVNGPETRMPDTL